MHLSGPIQPYHFQAERSLKKKIGNRWYKDWWVCRIFPLAHLSTPSFPVTCLKGLGHEIECKYFDKNGSFWVYIRSFTGFLSLQMSLWWAVVFAIFSRLKCHFFYIRNYIYWSSLPNYLAALLVFYWFFVWTLDSYWSTVPTPI